MGDLCIKPFPQPEKLLQAFLLNSKELIPSRYNPVHFGEAQRVGELLFPLFLSLPSCNCPTWVCSVPLWLHLTALQRPTGGAWNPAMFSECPLVDYMRGAETSFSSIERPQAVLSVFSCHCTNFRDNGSQTQQKEGFTQVKPISSKAKARMHWGHVLLALQPC